MYIGGILGRFGHIIVDRMLLFLTFSDLDVFYHRVCNHVRRIHMFKNCLLVIVCPDCSILKNGTDYTGQRSTAMNTQSCAPWANVSREYNSSEFGSESMAGLFDYCRNPSHGNMSGPGPWCHSMLPGEEVMPCSLPLCRGE